MASEAKDVAIGEDSDVDDLDDTGEQPPMTFAELGFASEDDLEAYIQEGIDSFERDGGIPHHVVMAEMRAIIAKHRG